MELENWLLFQFAEITYRLEGSNPVAIKNALFFYKNASFQSFAISSGSQCESEQMNVNFSNNTRRRAFGTRMNPFALMLSSP
jgi:hypothetical protein